MADIPANVIEKMGAEGTVKTLVTASADGQPHAIVCGSIISPEPSKMIVGEILMHKSAQNLAENPKAAFMIAAGMEAWEIDVKNPVRIAEGPALDQMNAQLEAIHLHANALWMFDVDAVYDQGANPNAGKKIA
ncbi:pyridoxamine 5'-phosphate oxidase family protein [Candidatus Methanoprimaticola sp. MG2]|uniref:pyridoxamine 5'-phosphate oxidase family protein n=1 Tax=Candidatus Methanoprimaticola sp. MG2 TaxID=3228838 RepID=UPI0039C71057